MYSIHQLNYKYILIWEVGKIKFTFLFSLTTDVMKSCCLEVHFSVFYVRQWNTSGSSGGKYKADMIQQVCVSKCVSTYVQGSIQ